MNHAIATRSVPSIVAWFATIFAAVVLLSGAGGALTAKRLMTRADAMVMRNAVIINDSAVRPGDPILISYDYDKRADCTPPRGRGDFVYKAWKQDPDGQFRHNYRIESGLGATEPYGKNLHAVNEIEMPILKPGVYKIQIKAVFQCRGEAEPQILWFDDLPPVVIAP